MTKLLNERAWPGLQFRVAPPIRAGGFPSGSSLDSLQQLIRSDVLQHRKGREPVQRLEPLVNQGLLADFGRPEVPPPLLRGPEVGASTGLTITPGGRKHNLLRAITDPPIEGPRPPGHGGSTPCVPTVTPALPQFSERETQHFLRFPTHTHTLYSRRCGGTL